MILWRLSRSLPYILLAACWGYLVGLVCDMPPLLIAGLCAAVLLLLIGNTIWRERKIWDQLDARAKRCDVDLRRL